MAKNDKREAAKKLAAAGASAQKIERQTGVSSAAATKMAAKAAPTNNMKINYQDVINNPGAYDQGYTREAYATNPNSVIGKGLYGGGLSDSEGGTYNLQGFYVPGATTGIGPNKDVLFAAGPNANQEWMNANFGPGGRYYGGANTAATAATPGTATTTPDTAAASSRMSLKDADTLGQALRVAGGGNGNISNKELMKIGKQFDVGNDKIVRRLDTVNSNRLKNRKASIGLGSNAYNKLTSRGLMDNMFTNYGEGYLGQAITKGMPQMYGGKSMESGMTDPLRVRKGLTVTGLSAKGDVDTREKFLNRGGFNRPMVKGTAAATETATVNTGTGTGAGAASATDTTNVPMTPQDMAAASTVSDGQLGGIGADLANWATGFKRKSSSRKVAGSRAQGPGSQRVNPTGSFRGGM
jgi:hypothetical protein